jgi:hypothetical protein
MRRIKEVLRLKHVQGLPERAIARTVGVSNGVVHGYPSRARAAGLSWPLPDGMTDEDLEFLLFPAPKAASQSPLRPVPDWSHVDKELRRRNMTRRLLWEEFGPPVRTVSATRGSAQPMRPGRAASGPRCGRPISAARRSSSISPPTPSTSSTP